MRKVYITLLMLSIVFTQTDLSVPANSMRASIGNFSLSWCITPNKSIIFNINQSAFGYFGLSYLPTMRNVHIS
jgi:hypothetical protein